MAERTSLDEFMEKRRSHVGKAEGGQEVVFKGFKAPPSFNAEERSAEFIMSSERIDRDGDIVRQKGIGLAEFKKNPQGLLFHQSRSWPVGKWSDVRKDLKTDPPSTSGKFNFLPAGGPVAEIDQAFWMVQHGAIRTVSIGFMPLELEEIEHAPDSGSPWSWGFDILKSELYECSLVPVPAQPDALAKGLIEKGEMAPAREFLELALDEWARDPRTSMFVPRKKLTATYRRFFGKSAVTVMALDSVLPAEKSALRRVEEAITRAAEEHGIKQLPVPGDPTDGQPEGDQGEIEAISGVEIEFPITVNLTITQGNTGANTRVGTEVGDTGTAAADANVQGNGVNQREVEPEHKEPHPLLTRAKEVLRRFFGDEKPAIEEPNLVPGAYELRKERLSAAMARLQGLH
jgi:hypothetical protein